MKRLNKVEIWFIASALVMLITLVFGSLFALRFVSVSLVNSVSYDVVKTAEVKFNLEELEKFNLPQ